VSRSSLLDREPSEIKLRRTPSEARREEIRLQRTPSEIRRDSEARLRRTPSEIRRESEVRLRRTPSETRREFTEPTRRRSSGREGGKSSDVVVTGLISPGVVSAATAVDRYPAAGISGGDRYQQRPTAGRRSREDDQPASLDYVVASAFTCEDSPSLRYMDSLSTTYNGEVEANSGLAPKEEPSGGARPLSGTVKRKESLQQQSGGGLSQLDRSSESNKGMCCANNSPRKD
jgi:hypothetical protein